MATEFQLKVYVYYYPWYSGVTDDKWNLCREYSPYLGFYDSSDPEVVRRHVEWAIEYGIDGFLVEWFGFETEHTKFVDGCVGVLRDVLHDYPGFEFAVFYDQGLRFGTKRDFSIPGNRSAFTYDLRYAVQRNFNHPNYMRIDGRPVLVIYLTRGCTGDYHGLLGDLREWIAESGYGKVYLIGDEIWWREKTANFSVLDAVTAYSLQNDREKRNTNADARQYAVHTAALFERMLPAAVADGADVIPGIGHAGNTGHFRDHLPYIPTVVPDAPPAYREDMIECLRANRNVWRDSPRFQRTGRAYIFISSFNEWPERTVVEPTAEIETFNKLYDFRYDKYLYLQPARFEYLEGIREGKRLIERNLLPLL